MRFIGILLLVFSVSAYANAETYKIDISKCGSKSCFSVFNKTFTVGKDIRVVAWADVVDAFNKGVPGFYPLFNIYNKSSSAIAVEIGMQLLDENKKVLAERIQKTNFPVYNPKASKYEIYRSLNAIRLTKKIIARTKYVNIIVRK
jgi:hypothetical protein